MTHLLVSQCASEHMLELTLAREPTYLPSLLPSPPTKYKYYTPPDPKYVSDSPFCTKALKICLSSTRTPPLSSPSHRCPPLTCTHSAFPLSLCSAGELIGCSCCAELPIDPEPGGAADQLEPLLSRRSIRRCC
jgi:hypothetical protein